MDRFHLTTPKSLTSASMHGATAGKFNLQPHLAHLAKMALGQVHIGETLSKVTASVYSA
jgi:hypothetical protein